MGSDFASLGINFQARTVIFGSWTPIFREGGPPFEVLDTYFGEEGGGALVLIAKNAFAYPPLRSTKSPFFQS